MGKNYYWLTGMFLNHEPDASDTDEWALANNFVSVHERGGTQNCGNDHAHRNESACRSVRHCSSPLQNIERNTTHRADALQASLRAEVSTRCCGEASYGSEMQQLPACRIGWGGRIRTSEWRDQNPLPYHLATPQRVRPVSPSFRPRHAPRGHLRARPGGARPAASG